MVNISEMILMGVVATLFMDFFAKFLGELKVINQHIRPEAVGRWILYMFRGKFIHEDINETPALRGVRHRRMTKQSAHLKFKTVYSRKREIASIPVFSWQSRND